MMCCSDWLKQECCPPLCLFQTLFSETATAHTARQAAACQTLSSTLHCAAPVPASSLPPACSAPSGRQAPSRRGRRCRLPSRGLPVPVPVLSLTSGGHTSAGRSAWHVPRPPAGCTQLCPRWPTPHPTHIFHANSMSLNQFTGSWQAVVQPVSPIGFAAHYRFSLLCQTPQAEA